MRPSFLARLVNGPLFDPAVFVRFLNRKTAFLFDCGRIENLSNREILSVGSLFISHLHMDHFVGFDHILRVILHREMPLYIYGPEGTVDKVISRLGSYTWNLTGGYPLEIVIHDVMEKEIVTCSARVDDGFARRVPTTLPRQGATIAKGPFYGVDAFVLDHNVPCLGFVLKEAFHININAQRVADLGYTTGPWIGLLKERIFAGSMDDLIDVSTNSGTRLIRVGELSDELVITSPGQKMAYITDIRASKSNLKIIMAFADAADILFIETYYLEERWDEARRKAHLTAGEAGMVAGRIGAKKVVPMHISPRYHNRIHDIMRELEAARTSA